LPCSNRSVMQRQPWPMPCLDLSLPRRQVHFRPDD
jgi:hypothetical protein